MYNSSFVWLALLAAVPLGASPISATFAGVNGQTAFGYYVGPYSGFLDDVPVVLNCVDFANDVTFGQQWSANLSHINTESDLANTRYGGMSNSLQLYQEAAWLTSQYSLNPASDYADIQTTIWRLFDIYAPAPTSGYWLNLAQANYASASYNNFFVVTNLGPVLSTGQVQEFITVLDPSTRIYPGQPLTDVVSTAEPRFLAFWGVALICIASLLGRLARRSS